MKIHDIKIIIIGIFIVFNENVFTNLAIKGIALKYQNRGKKSITTEYGLNSKKVMFSIKDFGRKLGKVLVKVNKDKSKIWRK